MKRRGGEGMAKIYLRDCKPRSTLFHMRSVRSCMGGVQKMKRELRDQGAGRDAREKMQAHAPKKSGWKNSSTGASAAMRDGPRREVPQWWPSPGVARGAPPAERHAPRDTGRRTVATGGRTCECAIAGEATTSADSPGGSSRSRERPTRQSSSAGCKKH